MLYTVTARVTCRVSTQCEFTHSQTEWSLNQKLSTSFVFVGHLSNQIS